MKSWLSFWSGLALLLSIIGTIGPGYALETAEDDWGYMGSYGAFYDVKTVETCTGRITDVKIISLGTRKGCFCIALEVNDGDREHTAYLGPKSYIKKRGYSFDVGETITFTGSNVTIKGRPLVLVRDVKVGDRLMRFRTEDGRHL